MGRNVRATVGTMAFKGYGVARVEGRVVFLPYSVTGDEAWIEIVEEKQNYALGRLERLIVPSPWRVSPPCPYFGRCGGCHWQHIEGIKQAEIKRDIFQDILRRLGGVEEIPPVPIIPSPRPYGYRARVQLKVAGKALGFYQAGSHQIVEIDHCPISHPLINQILSILREEQRYLSSFKEIEIRVSPEEGKGVLILQSNFFQQRQHAFAGRLLHNHSVLKGIAITGRKGSLSFGDPFLTFSVFLDPKGEKRRLNLRASPGSFFQVNLEQNQALIDAVLQFGEVKGEERVLDLYAGIGNLTLPLAFRARDANGVEESKAAVEDARFNARENEINRCGFLSGRTEEVLRLWAKEKPDLAVLDPPRAGGKKIINGIAGLGSKRIVYVSCDPATLSRDLRLFAETGYLLERLSLIDMFPQTYHMEAVALLSKTNRMAHRA
jgi:23S rRNA (uracil1939-C5)-methyltransferase